MVRVQEKIDVAVQLKPLYDTWHASCIKSYDSTETQRASLALLGAVVKYKHLNIPQKREAAIGRWIAKILGMKWKCFGGIVSI